jgi:hypothetical protein
VIKPDCRNIHTAPRQMNQPGGRPGTAYLDYIGLFMGHDATGGSRGQHEAIRLLRGDRGATKPVATHARPFQYLVGSPGHNQYLPQGGIPLDVARLLQEICADASRGLTEEFRDIQNAQGAGSQRCGELRVCNVERCTGCDAEGLQIEYAGGGISQNNRPEGTSFRSCCSGSYSPTGDPEPRSRSDCMSGGWRGGGAAGQTVHELPLLVVAPIPASSLAVAAPLPRCPAAYSSRYAPVRNGLVSRSMPTVVSGP